jgi:hypothetical protein
MKVMQQNKIFRICLYIGNFNFLMQICLEFKRETPIVKKDLKLNVVFLGYMYDKQFISHMSHHACGNLSIIFGQIIKN